MNLASSSSVLKQKWYSCSSPNHRGPAWKSWDKLISLLKSCKQTSEISQVHGLIVKTGADRDHHTVSKLIASSIHDAEYAASIFDRVREPNLFMFNSLMRAHSMGYDPKQALDVFSKLRTQGIVMDRFSLIMTVKACTREMDVKTGQGIHGVALRYGYMLFIDVKNSLLHLYGIGGRINDAYNLFDEFPEENDLVSWNTLLRANVNESQPAATVEFFKKLLRCSFGTSAATILCALSAFNDLGNLPGGDSIHGHCIKAGFCSQLNVMTALIETYGNTMRTNLGRKVFDEITDKDVILWNCMIDKYAKAGKLQEAVALLHLMKLEGARPNSSTLASLISACATSNAVKLSHYLSDFIEKERLELDAILGTSLVDMFAKFGLLDKSVRIFEGIEIKDVKCWTAMIVGYGLHGHAKDAIALFCRMEEEGFIPNETTFLGVFGACSHGGLLMEALTYFEKMIRAYGIFPAIEHYGCLIDVLGRVGLLEEAFELIKSLPIRTDSTAWRALLAGCRVHGDVQLGERVRRILVDVEDHPTDPILLRNAYAIVGRLPDYCRRQEREEDRKKPNTGNGLVGKKVKIPKQIGSSIIIHID